MSFKSEILNFLGIKLDPQITGDAKNNLSARAIDKFKSAYKSNNTGSKGSYSSVKVDAFSSLINDYIVNKAKSEIGYDSLSVKNKTNADKELSNKIQEYENSLKSYSINDILSRADGINVNNSLFKANTADYFKRASGEAIVTDKNNIQAKESGISYNGEDSELKLFDKQPDLIKKKINDNVFCFYAKKDFNLTKKQQIKKGQIIIVSRKNVKITSGDKRLFSADSPAQTMEYALQRFYGGQQSYGSRDSITDIMSSGIPVSVKCIKKNGSVNIGSKDAISEIKGKFHLEVWEYEDINVYNKEKTTMSVYLCTRKANKCKIYYKDPKDGLIKTINNVDVGETGFDKIKAKKGTVEKNILLPTNIVVFKKIFLKIISDNCDSNDEKNVEMFFNEYYDNPSTMLAKIKSLNGGGIKKQFNIYRQNKRIVINNINNVFNAFDIMKNFLRNPKQKQYSKYYKIYEKNYDEYKKQNSSVKSCFDY